MKYILAGVIAFLLYNSPDARNATSEILRQRADLLQTEQIQRGCELNKPLVIDAVIDGTV